MNLADAIRKAAKFQVEEKPTIQQPKQQVPWPEPREFEEKQEVNPTEKQAETPIDLRTRQIDISGRYPEPPSSAILSGNAVRLELFLSGEQMSAMLKAIMAGQHSVLTLREAASYLRVTPSTLEKWAAEEEVPAVNIDGRWRFPKTNLDEWLAEKASGSREEDKNVA